MGCGWIGYGYPSVTIGKELVDVLNRLLICHKYGLAKANIRATIGLMLLCGKR